MAGYGEDLGTAMRPLIIIMLMSILLAGCMAPMTEDERRRYNSGPLFPECKFDEQGQPDRARCNDFRLVNHNKYVTWSGWRITTGGGFFLTPARPQHENIEIPDGVHVVWHDRVSKTEVACRRLMGDQPVYPTACHHPATDVIHVTRGDWPALRHEIRHRTDGQWH